MSMIVNLECSRNTIKCVCMQKKGGSFLVAQAHTLNIPCDLFKEENSEKVVSLLRDFLKLHRIPRTQVYFSICHGDIVFQELTLPDIPIQEIHEAVKNEIERVPQFAAQEYHYSYQAYPQPGENKVHVLSLAMPQNVFDVPLKILKSAGCVIQGFDVVPLSVISLAEQAAVEKDVSVLVVCEEITYFLVMRNKLCHKIYLANSGSNDLMRNTTTVFNEGALRSWVDEIRRILKFYEVEQHTALPQMYLVWNDEHIQGLEKHLRTLLPQPVVPLELPQSIQFSKKRNFIKLNQIYVPLVGMALSSNAHRKFNLERIWNKRKTGQYQRKIIVCGIVYLICMMLLGGKTISFLSHKIDSLNGYQQELARQIGELEKRTDKLRAERSYYEQLKENILKQATVISNLNRRSWAKAFAKVGENLPNDVWLKLFMFSRQGKCEIEGKSFQLDSLAGLMRALEATKYFSEIKLDFTKERQTDSGEEFVEFGMQMNVLLDENSAKKGNPSVEKRTKR